MLVAAGSGTRAGDGPPKQFRVLGGARVLERAWRPFAASRAVGEMVLVVPPEVAADPPAWLLEAPARLVAGGASRTESVRLGLGALETEVETVLVHDGVRPFASAALVERVLGAARSGPVVPLVPVLDTIKVVDPEGSAVLRTLERSSLRRAQTPQGFPAPLLREVHEWAARDGRRATDDAALCEAAGHAVTGVPGESTNVKLTTPADFTYAAWLLETGRVP